MKWEKRGSANGRNKKENGNTFCDNGLEEVREIESKVGTVMVEKRKKKKVYVTKKQKQTN